MKPGRKLEFRKAFLSLGEKLHEFSQVIDPGEEATGRVRALYSGGTGPYAEAATEERVELLIATSNEGDVEIVNPTPEQVEQLLAGHAPQAPSG